MDSQMDDVPPDRHQQTIVDGVQARERARVQARERARGPALLGLNRIVTAIRSNPGSGQVRRLVAFLGGLYNGERFPFDMTELRSLDSGLSDACLDVLAYDRFGVQEIHCWGVISGDDLNDLLAAYGHYYRAQQNRIGRSLYQERYGDDGHADEGLSA